MRAFVFGARLFFTHLFFIFFRRNIYSDDLLKTLYIDPDLNHIKENDPSNTDNNQQQKETNTVYDQKNGVRCIRFVKYRAQPFTSLMADLCQDINRDSSFSSCLDGTFA